MNDPDVVFVGAGPVGLYTAIQAKLYNPALKILMIDRHQEYKRTHGLLIDKTSYNGSHPDGRLQDILKDLHGFTPTAVIEQKFKQLANELGIEFEYKKIDNIDHLASQYHTAHSIVGADGAKSSVRQQIFNNELAVQETLQYIVEVKYQVQGKTKKFPINQLKNVSTEVEHLVQENVGKERNGQSPVSLFVFVNAATAAALQKDGAIPMGDYTAEKLKNSQDANIQELANTVLPWLSYRAERRKEIRVAGSQKIAVVELKTYQSKAAVGNKDGKRYVLIGDALMGMPYFRALNAGLLGGNQAAKLISQAEAENTFKNEPYQAFVTALARKEFADAASKNIKINIGKRLLEWWRLMIGRVVADTLPDKHYKALEEARVTPLPFYKRHRKAITRTALFSALNLGLWLSGAVATIPLAPFLLAYMPIVPASIIVALAITILAAVAYEVGTWCVRKIQNWRHRREPVTEIEKTAKISETQEYEELVEHEQDKPKEHFASPLSSGQFPWQKEPQPNRDRQGAEHQTKPGMVHFH